jgi:hypothetical protein
MIYNKDNVEVHVNGKAQDYLLNSVLIQQRFAWLAM